ncbi:MAG: alpha/beta hydrolase [Methylophilaceae bacterium]
MSLNESTLNLLGVLAEAEVKPFHEGTPEDARIGIDMLMSNNPNGPQDVSVTDYKLADSGVTLRVITPPTDAKSIIIYYHGGGWVCGSIDAYESLGRGLSKEASAIVVLVNYRLAPEHPFPTPVDDCWDALLWVDANREVFNGQNLSIVLSGDSAGGNLAAVITQRSTERDHAPRVALQALIYPATDTELDTPSSLSEENQLLLCREDMAWFWNQYVGSSADRSDSEMAPVRSNNLAKLPPTLVITAQHDVLHDDGQRYVEKLKAAGVDVQYLDAEGETHGFMCLYGIMPSCQWAVDSIISFINARI